MNLTAYAVFLVVAAGNGEVFAEAFPRREPPLPVLGDPSAAVAGEL